MENLFVLLGLFPAVELAKSMKRDKTLTVMVVIGVVAFACFGLFLVSMSS